MNRGQKTSLQHAANAIDGTRGQMPRLGANPTRGQGVLAFDRKSRPLPSTYLATRKGYSPLSAPHARDIVAREYGLSLAQVQKLDSLAASTHNILQRGERIASFIRRAVAQPGYLGRSNPVRTGAVNATL